MRDNQLLRSAIAVLFAFVAQQGACCKRAFANPKAPTCANAYERAQEFRSAAKLRAAHEMLEVCARQTCGKFMYRECAAWLEELEKELPSVILSVKNAAGVVLEDVEVSVDGVSLDSALLGAALAVDPGVREFRFKAEGYAEVLHRLNILEGQQNLPVKVHLRGRADQAAVRRAHSRRVEAVPENHVVAGTGASNARYVIGGVGVLGFVGFAVLGTLGRTAQRELGACLPDCARADVERVSTLYAAANVSLGVGIVGIGTATVLLLTSRGSSEARRPSPSASKKLHAVDVRQTRGGLFAELRGSF